MRERRTYLHPPIEEALCEVRFSLPGPPDFLAPLRVYEYLNDTYPEPPQPQSMVRASFGSLPESGGEPAVAMRGAPRMKLASADGRRVASVSHDSISIHDLSPYSGWERFRERIQNAVNSFASAQRVNGITRIGIRYINRISISDDEIDLEDYFASPPTFPDVSTPIHVDSLFFRTVSTYTKEPIQLRVTLASVESTDERSSFILDVDLSQEWEKGQELLIVNDAQDAIEHLRDLERDAFESLITDRLREMFDA